MPSAFARTATATTWSYTRCSCRLQYESVIYAVALRCEQLATRSTPNLHLLLEIHNPGLLARQTQCLHFADQLPFQPTLATVRSAKG